MKSKQNLEFEVHLQKGLVQRRIEVLLNDLDNLHTYLDLGEPLYKHLIPQHAFIDLAIEYGKLIQMERGLRE